MPDSHDIHSVVAWWGEYLDYFNCLYLLLDSAVIKTMNLVYFNLTEVTNKDTMRISYEDGKEKGATIANQSVTFVYQMARYIGNYSLPMDVDPRLAMRHVLPKDVFDCLAKSFGAVVERKTLVPLLSGVAKGLSEYKVGNYTTSLILAWFVIETILNQKWENLLKSKDQIYPDGSKRINTDRKDKLTGRDYPVSVTLLWIRFFRVGNGSD